MSKEKILAEAQLYQQQMQTIISQKDMFNMQLYEIKNAIESVENSKESNVYKITGPILIKTPKADIKKDLKEKEELIDLRIKTLNKSEEKIKSMLEDIKEKLSKEN